MSQALIPNLRFKEFLEPWLENKLSYFVDINPKKSTCPNDGLVSFIPMNAVSEESQVIYKDVVFYDDVSKGFTSFENNDVLLAKITPCFENGKGAFVSDLVNGIGFGSTEFHVLRSSRKSYSKFIFNYINTPKFRLKGEMNMQGSAGQKRVTTDFLKNYRVAFPSIIEQQKIASFLTSIDSKISQLTEKHRLLKEYKKGVMQQIFSQQLRFKDEGGKAFPEWGNPFLSTVSTLITNGFVGTATPYYTDDTGIPYLYGVNIKNNRINKKSLRYITPEFHKKQLKTNLKIGDLLMVQSGHVGETAIVTEEFVDSNCHALIVTKLMQDKMLPDFINFYFSSGIGKSKLEALKVGSTIIHINTNDLKKFKIPLPSFQEQQKIAQFLQSIDKKIDTVAQQVEQTKQFKKGLLQQMFV
jgi:type I restriction enzyme S subunit